jgi:FAD dependent oxidoreductase TIGR03364
MRAIIVGAGVLGTMHAWHAVSRGHDVVHIEREAAARGASVRNFGLVWAGGRAPGPELEAARRSRVLWEEIADRVPALGFRPSGSLTVATTPHELAVAEAAAEAPDAGERGYRLLAPDEVREVNPALRGDHLGALWCRSDAQVEPRTAQAALQAELRRSGRYTLLTGREVRDLAGPGAVRDDHGEVHRGDTVVLCTGAWLGGLVRELLPDLPVRRVRLQMAQTAPLGETLTTAVADGDSFRYYPAYRGPALDGLNAAQPQPPVARDHRMQLLMVQRADGSLTVGDTHEYDAHDFGGQDAAMDYLADLQANNVGPSSSTGALGPKVDKGELLVANGDVQMNMAQARTMPDIGIWFPAHGDGAPTTFALPYTAGLVTDAPQGANGRALPSTSCSPSGPRSRSSRWRAASPPAPTCRWRARRPRS